MRVISECCADLDVHKKAVIDTVLITKAEGQFQKSTCIFSTMTADLLRLDEWLDSLQVGHLALESNGVHRYPIFLTFISFREYNNFTMK
jgi:transposase